MTAEEFCVDRDIAIFFVQNTSNIIQTDFDSYQYPLKTLANIYKNLREIEGQIDTAVLSPNEPLLFKKYESFFVEAEEEFKEYLPFDELVQKIKLESQVEKSGDENWLNQNDDSGIDNLMTDSAYNYLHNNCQKEYQCAPKASYELTFGKNLKESQLVCKESLVCSEQLEIEELQITTSSDEDNHQSPDKKTEKVKLIESNCSLLDSNYHTRAYGVKKLAYHNRTRKIQQQKFPIAKLPKLDLSCLENSNFRYNNGMKSFADYLINSNKDFNSDEDHGTLTNRNLFVMKLVKFIEQHF